MMDGEDELPLTEVFSAERTRPEGVSATSGVANTSSFTAEGAEGSSGFEDSDTDAARLADRHHGGSSLPRLLSKPMLPALQPLFDLRLLCSPWPLPWTTFATKWRACVVVWTLPTIAHAPALQGLLLPRSRASPLWNTSSGLWRHRFSRPP